MPDHGTRDDSAPASDVAGSDTEDDMLPSPPLRGSGILRRASTTSTGVTSVLSSLSSSNNSSSAEGLEDSERGDAAPAHDDLSEWFNESFRELEEFDGSAREQACASLDEIAACAPAVVAADGPVIGKSVALRRCDAVSECDAAVDDGSSTAAGLAAAAAADDDDGNGVGHAQRDDVEEEDENEEGGEDPYGIGPGVKHFWVEAFDRSPVAVVEEGNGGAKDTSFRTLRRRTSPTQESHAEPVWCGKSVSHGAQEPGGSRTSTMDYEDQDDCQHDAQARSTSDRPIPPCQVEQAEGKQAQSTRSVDASALCAAGTVTSRRYGNSSGDGVEVGSGTPTLVKARPLEQEEVAAEDAWISETLLEEPFGDGGQKGCDVGEGILDCPLYLL